MTSSTHTGEEKEEEETKGVSVSNCAVLRDPEHQGTRLLSQAAHSSSHSHVKEGIPQTGTFLSVSQPTHAKKHFLFFAASSIILCLVIFLFLPRG